MVWLRKQSNSHQVEYLGYDSGVSSTAQSFKASSTEEEPTVTARKRSAHDDQLSGRGRPVSWHSSRPHRGQSRNASLVMQDSSVLPRDRGRLTRDTCVMSRDPSDDRVRPYDADDETEIPAMFFTEAGVRVKMPETRRQRPTSLHGVTSLYPQQHSYQGKYEKRSHRSVNGRRRVTKYCDLKRKLPLGYISNSDVPRPYHSSGTGKITELHDIHPLYHVKRRRSEDLVEADNLNNEASLRLRDSKDSMVGRVMRVRCLIT